MKNLFNNISQEEKNRILEMHSGKKNVISEQISQIEPQSNSSTPSQTISLKQIMTILGSLGFKNSPSSGYKLHMDKPNNGAIKDRNGNYVASYEAYIPTTQNQGVGYTDGKTMQLWIDKRSGLKQGKDEPNTYNLVFDLTPNQIKLQKIQNGKVIGNDVLSVSDFYQTLKSYK
jgi:hypothetical protein